MISILTPYYKTMQAFDGQDALDVIRKSPPALIVTDVMMPRLDGWGLMKALHEGLAASSGC